MDIQLYGANANYYVALRIPNTYRFKVQGSVASELGFALASTGVEEKIGWIPL